jgi:DNA-binding response OmpR family regulator
MKKHVVIIEDDTYMLEAMGGVLEKEGYQTTKLMQLSTLDELLELGADCFIIDEKLPYVNGHIICIMLKSKPATQNVPVILTSAYSQLENFAGLCKADSYLKKPFLNAHELLGMVESTIKNKLNFLNNSVSFS